MVWCPAMFGCPVMVGCPAMVGSGVLLTVGSGDLLRACLGLVADCQRLSEYRVGGALFCSDEGCHDY